MDDKRQTFATADLHDAQPGDVRVIDLKFRSFGRRRCFYGPVETLRVCSSHSAVRDAMREPGAGRVLVVDGGGDTNTGIMGDQIGANAERNGWAGAILVGAVRDSRALDQLDIGVRALGTTARRCDEDREGQRGVILRVGGVIVRPGDWIYADEDAVIVAARPLALA